MQRSVIDSFGNIGDLTVLTVSNPGDFFVGGPGGPSAAQNDVVLNDKAIADFMQIPGVLATSPQLRLQATTEFKLNRAIAYSNISGLDTSQMRLLDIEMESGTSSLGQWQAIVGVNLANSFYNRQNGQPLEDVNLQGQTLQLELTKFQGEFSEPIKRTVQVRVVGVMAESGGERDYTVYMPIRHVKELNQWASGERKNYSRDGYENALVKVESPEAATAVTDIISAQGFFVFSFQDVLQSINITFLIIQAIVGGIGALALLVAAFGIANTMIMSIYERTREIGLMKAVGATNRDIMFIFLGEAGTIGLIGGIGGVITGVLLGQLGGFIGRQYLLQQIAQSGGTGEELSALVFTPAWLPIFAILFATFIGVISGIYPALRAVRLDPIAALRYE